MTRVLVAALSALAACTVGIEVHEFKPAQGPAGVHGTVTLNRGLVEGNTLSGELLSAGRDGLVFLLREPLATDEGAQRLLRVPLWMMRSIKLEQMGQHRIASEGREMDEAKLRRLQLVSRYPQGLSAEIERKLLAGLGQASTYTPRAREQPE